MSPIRERERERERESERKADRQRERTRRHLLVLPRKPCRKQHKSLSNSSVSRNGKDERTGNKGQREEEEEEEEEELPV
jgi:hypothetical protein